MSDIASQLAACFDPSEVKWKPAVVSGNRALALAYITSRAVMDRLDEVLGIDGWQDDYECLPSGSVVCRLRCRINGEWVVKTDVGSLSEQPDDGDKTKAAFSDAIKRCAVKFGIGRYLYRLPKQWVDYDPQTKQIKTLPKLPAWALPRNQPDPNGQPVVKQKLSDAEHDSQLLAVQDWLEIQPNLEAFNDFIDADLRAIKDSRLRGNVWRKLVKYAETKGWVQDKANRGVFLEGVKV